MTASYKTEGEDARASALIRTTLGAYVITAALAGVAGQATITTFVLDKRDHLAWFYVVAGAGFVVLVASAVAGALGISEIYDEGATGAWTRKTGHGKLNAQGILILLGIGFVVASVFLGQTKTSDPSTSPEIGRLAVALDGLRKQEAAVSTQLHALRQRDAAVSKQLHALRKELIRLRLDLRRRHRHY
jgi:hypothetical protein